MPLIKPEPTDIPKTPTPTQQQILAHQAILAPWVLATPIWPLKTRTRAELVGEKGELFFKIECWQHTGTFKARGAVTRLMSLTPQQREKGIVAASAGNHAIAASYAAHAFNTSAKVVMPKTASPVRVQACKNFQAEVIFTNSMHDVFNKASEIMSAEDRSLVHPYDGPEVALGTATLGAELCQQVADLDAVIIAVGGGGLIAGMSSAIKQMQPHCKVYGVEPSGANTMSLSFQAGKPLGKDQLTTIADSLCAPYACAYSYSLCQQHVDALVNVSDDAIREAMRWFYSELKLALEPAGATALAGLMGPLRTLLRNQRTAILVCGSNLDIDTYHRQLSPAH